MGLDMYALAAPKDAVTQEVDFDFDAECEKFHQWRGHSRLHYWMQQLYYDKGGESLDFNCSMIVLNADDIDALETAIRENGLPYTDVDECDGRDQADDLAFIVKAREVIRTGRVVIYYAWY